MQDRLSGKNPHREGESSLSSFATMWILAIKSNNSSAEKTDVNLAYAPLSHQYDLIKCDKDTRLEINP